jgi:hypothetical protein
VDILTVDALPRRRGAQLDQALADVDRALASVRDLPNLDDAVEALERVRRSLVAERDAERRRAERDWAAAVELGRWF